MSTERVGIYIDIMGYDKAASQMEALQSKMNGLNGHKAKIKLQAEIDKLNLNKAALKSQKVKLQADMSQVDKELRTLQQRIKTLRNTKARLKLDGASASVLKAIDRQIVKLQSRVNLLNGSKISIQGNLAQVNNEINQTTAAIQRLKTAMAGIKTQSLGQIWSKSASTFAHVGQAMQSAGNAITRMGAPIRNLGRMMGLGAGFAAFGKVSEGIQSGFSRYDTMKKYPKIMSAFGYSAEQAKKSIDAMDKSVRGLPTGLDEMVDMSQRFTATTGDIEKGTKLAIAANNAFLASMSTDTQKYQGMMQLQDVLGGKDMNAREWNSLVSSMTPAVVKMGESMGYTSKNMDEWIQKVRDGKVANEDFIDTLIKVGSEGGEVAKMAQESKDTWQAFAANVGNAFSRMSAGIIQSMDEVVSALNITDKDGNKIDSVNRFLSEKMIPQIDKLTESAKKWIRANPDKITDFFKSLKSVDWKSLGKGFLDGISFMAKGIKSLADAFGGKNLAKIGFISSLLMPIGSVLTIVGGLLKGGRHILGGVPALGMGLGRLLYGLGEGLKLGGMAAIGGKIQKFIEGLKNFGKLKAATEAAETAAEVTAKKGLKIGKHLKTMLGALGGVAIVSAVPVVISGGIMLTIKAVKSIIKDLGTITKDMDNIDTGNLKKLTEVGATIGVLITTIGGTIGALATAGGGAGWLALGGVVGGIGVLSGVITGLAGLAKLFTGGVKGAIKNLADATKSMGDIADNMSKLKGKRFDTNALKSAVGDLADVGKILKDKNLPTSSEASVFKTLYDNLKDSITSIRQSADELKKIEAVKFDVDKAKQKAEKIGEGMVDVYNAIKEGIEEGGGALTRKEAKRSDKASTIVSNIQGMLSSITGSFDDLNAILDANLQFADTGRGPGGKGIVSKARQIASGIWDTYDAVYKAIAGEDTTTEYQTGGKGQKTQTRSATTKAQITPAMMDNITNLGTFMEQMTGVFTQLRSAYDSITGDNALGDIDPSAFEESSTIAGDLIKSIGNMWAKIQPSLSSLGDVGGEDISAQFEGLLSMIKGIKPVITEIATMSQELGAMGGEEGGLGGLSAFGGMDEGVKGRPDLSGILGMLPGMIQSMKQVSDMIGEMDFETTLPNLDSLKIMLDKIQELSTYMQELGTQIGEMDFSGLNSFAGKIQSFVQQVNTALNVATIATIQESINQFRTAVNTMIQTLNTDFANVKVTVNIDGEVTGDEELVQELNDAHDAIKEAKDAIKKLSGNIALNISVSLNLSGVDSAVARLYSAAARIRAAKAALNAAQNAATGGMITPVGVLYRSRGGNVPQRSFPGHPRGTDTVPTWLTPGEYVTKKKAVNFWGLDFMRSINHMDIRGVLQSASAKANSVMNSAKTTIINNNITNNYNNSNTQHIQTNNPNFAYRRSRRALGMI